MNGINLEKAHGLLQGSLGIKVMNRRNQKKIDQKVRGAISELYKIREEENLVKHVEASKLLPGYEPIRFTYNGMSCEATPGPAAQDGAGKKRAYNHQINGDETAFIVQSGVAGVPLTMVHSQVRGMQIYYELNFKLTTFSSRVSTRPYTTE